MATWHGFGTEKEQYRKLVEFMKGPSSFFEKNKDDHDAIVDFYTFTMRVTMAITLFMTAFTIVMIPFFAVIIVLARFITRFFLWLGGHVLNFFVRLIAKKDDFMAAKRAIAFSNAASLISPIPIIGFIGFFVSLYLEALGISGQYKVSFGTGLAVVLVQMIVLLIIIAIPFMLLLLPFLGAHMALGGF